MDSATFGFLVGSVFILFVLQKTVSIRRLLAEVGYHPGTRTLLSQGTLLANVLPPLSGIAAGRNHMFINKFRTFEHYGWDILAFASAFPAEINLNVAGPTTIKEITSSRARFPKLVDDYKALLFFGSNIIASEGETWKKYRKITSPSFNDRNNKLVWDETVKIMSGLFDSLWLDQEVVTVDHCVELTLPIALFVIGVAGFGRNISWQDDVVIPAGHKMTFKEALNEVSEGFFAKLALPGWLMEVSEKTRRIKLAYEELDKYMLEMINARRTSEKKEERYDLFSSLLDANDSPDYGQDPLTERELIGNIFVFLLAGHETTAHTLAFTFGLLAFYQEEQEILYQHIKSVVPDGRIPTYEEMPLFTQSMAVFYETLRMFPPVNGIPKTSAEDTTLVAENAKGETRVVPVPRGTAITIDVVGLHYNPRYWKDPEEFRPMRFREDWPRDAFLPFSGGARACMGRKFFETEGIAILTMLVSKYKISFKEEPQFANETMERRKERLFTTRPGLTLAPQRMPLVFTRRRV